MRFQLRGQVGTRQRAVVAGSCLCLMAVLGSACSVSGPSATTAATDAPTPTAAASTLAPTPSESQLASPAPSADGWRTYAGFGHWISYPAGWKVQARTDGTGIQLVSPETYPFVVVSNNGAFESELLGVLAEANLVNIREDMGSEDATSSPLALGADAAIRIAYHNIGDSGTTYYRHKVLWVHEGTAFELTLDSLAGEEAASDALLEQLLDSIAYPEATDLAFAELICSTPVGWTLKPVPGSGVARLGPNGQRILVAAGRRGDDTLASWSERTVTMLDERRFEGTEISRAPSTVGGVESVRLTFTLDSDNGPEIGFDEAFLKGDFGYDVMWISRDAGEEVVFQQIVDLCEFVP